MGPCQVHAGACGVPASVHAGTSLRSHHARDPVQGLRSAPEGDSVDFVCSSPSQLEPWATASLITCRVAMFFTHCSCTADFKACSMQFHYRPRPKYHFLTLSRCEIEFMVAMDGDKQKSAVISTTQHTVVSVVSP